jgi:hypothetical protein
VGEENEMSYVPKKRPLGEYKEDSLTKALPWIVGGIIAVVIYNFTKRRS